MNAGLSGSYLAEDVIFLLKPVSIMTTPIDLKEKMILSGKRHYSEMISEELLPDQDYLALFHIAFNENANRMAGDLERLAHHLARVNPRGLLLLSLARAGTPPGIVLARLIRDRGVACFHYSISIIRDRGIDTVALNHVMALHPEVKPVFFDGWTGKGTMACELHRCILEYNQKKGTQIDSGLVVLADICGQASLAATDEDYLIPSSILGGIISGLVSRSILNKDLTGPTDFHGCVVLDNHARHDISRWFVDEITQRARAFRVACKGIIPLCLCYGESGRNAIEKLALRLGSTYGGKSINRIKPGIGEVTRSLLRRVPEQIIVRNYQSPKVRHLLHLAKKRNVKMTEDSEIPYEAVAILKESSI